MDTQQFFSDVTTGKTQKPLRPWKPFFKQVPEKFNEVFNKYEGDFDKHIATSIPMYREMQLITGDAIVKAYEDKKHPYLIDIAGSEGTWAKAITECSGGTIHTEVVDCNEQMHEAFIKLRAPLGCNYFNGAFLESPNDTQVFKPEMPADVVHAGMAFQFMPFSRRTCIAEVKNSYLNEDGLFLIEEKVIPNQPREWFQNETLKNEFKKMYYSEEAIRQKQNSVVNNMDANLIRQDDLYGVLCLHFKHVHQYYSAGNFIGFACSDKKDTINNFGYKTITF